MVLPELLSNTKRGFILEGFLTSCSFNYLDRDYESRFYMMILLVGGFIIPLITIITFNFLMFIRLTPEQNLNSENIPRNQSKFKQIQDLLNTDENEIINIDDLDNLRKSNKGLKAKRNLHANNESINTNSSVKRLLIRREIKVAKKSLITIGLFSAAWLPYAFVACFAQFGTNIENLINPYTVSFTVLFAKSASIYNPIIYTISSRECLGYLKQKFCCKKNF